MVQEGWDVSKLVGLVSREELNAILAIPLRNGSLEDILMWAKAKNGLYYWRACIEALATNEALVKRRCAIPIVCRAKAPETIEHLLEHLDVYLLGTLKNEVSNKGFSLMSGYMVNEGVGNAQVDDFWVAPGTDKWSWRVAGLKGAKVDWISSPILLDILELLSSNEGFYVIFVRRQVNQAANWVCCGLCLL
ncbi:uncharacterized protein G2W53_033114 [Senna tora]|uniref:Uncharacterized protein n=1 Tax=Senna tora TaxID=362788 RepID=A0A834SX21_9FABA|nr:uncharacterized protein G2W53_033114 [Senna tora]